MDAATIVSSRSSHNAIARMSEKQIRGEITDLMIRIAHWRSVFKVARFDRTFVYFTRGTSPYSLFCVFGFLWKREGQRTTQWVEKSRSFLDGYGYRGLS